MGEESLQRVKFTMYRVKGIWWISYLLENKFLDMNPIFVFSVAVDPCDSDPCLNGGTCSVQSAAYRAAFYCICSVNFTGIFCASSVHGKLF